MMMIFQGTGVEPIPKPDLATRPRSLAPIGAGGMGEVYKAGDTRLDRDGANKISRGDFPERCRLEARAVAALSHPNICTVYDVGPNYLVMECIEGSPLKGPLPLYRALKYGTDLRCAR